MPSSSILTKSLRLLDLVAAEQTPLALAEIAERCGLPKSSTHRLLVLLRDSGALSYDPDRQTYRTGSRMMRWAVQSMTTSNMSELAAPHMKDLSRSSGMRVALSVLDGASVLYVQTVETQEPFRLAPKIGECSPLHASAAGKLFLAAMKKEALTGVLDGYDFEQCTEFTITTLRGLNDEIRKVKSDGYAISSQEEFRQTSGLAVPVTNEHGNCIAAISIWNVGGSDLVGTLKLHLTKIQNAAGAISASLGYSR